MRNTLNNTLITSNLNASLQRNDQWYGSLYPDEIALAKQVFGETLPYSRIFFTNTESHTQGITVATSPNRSTANYLLIWSEAYKTNVAKGPDRMKSTLIHELTHVWQSQYSGSNAMSYMAESVWEQLNKGTQDIFKDGYKKGLERIKEMIQKGIQKEWDHHRNMAYQFKMSDIGKNFNEFNVEQQALIIQSWYMQGSIAMSGFSYTPGKRSPKDDRFPYVRDCIRMRNPNAAYNSIHNPKGYSEEIAKIQSVLFSLGYIKEEKLVDGYWGRKTRLAVIEFQKRNGLKSDGDIGGLNSLTRKKLSESFDSLKGI